MRRNCRRLALVIGLLLPSVAFADPKDDARRHFTAGLEAAQSGQFELALQHFLAAQEAYPHPATIYNIARAYQDLNDLPNALSYYKLFRDANPAKAADVEPVIAVLEARLNQGQPKTPATSGGTGPTVVVGGVSPEMLDRMSALAAEFQALTEAIKADQASAKPPDTKTPTETNPAIDVAPDAPVPDLPEGGFLTDAYQRVVVTASRYGQDPIDSPSAVTILTEEDIRMSPATTLPELLRRVVGVEAMQLAAGHTDISMRGFNREINNKVLILVDGRSTWLDFIGATLFSILPITLEEIERIEVIRGPGSAVYGANAVTGIINIITKTPGEGKNIVTAEAGSPLYGRGSALLTGRAASTAYRFSAGYYQSGRWAEEYDPDVTTSRVFGPTNRSLGSQEFNAEGRLDRTFAKEGFGSISGGYSRSFVDYNNIGALGNYYMNMNHHYIRGDLAYGPGHLRVFWNHNDCDTAPWSEPADAPRSLFSTLDMDVVDVEMEGSKDFETGALKHRLNGGLSYRYKYTDFSYLEDPGYVRENHYAAFLQEQAKIGPLTLVGSMRADVHPLIKVSKTLSPRGAAILRVAKKTSVRASAGTAFRAPNHVESYMDFALPTGVDGAYIRDLGNRNLDPERLVTGEIGLHDESTPFHTADVSLYVNRLSKLIFLNNVTYPDVPNPYDPDKNGYEVGSTGWINLPAVYTGYGAEAEAEFFPVDGLDVYANANIQRIFQDENGEVTVDESTSLAKINGGVQYRTPFRVDLTGDVSYVSPQTWGIREYDANGVLVTNPKDIPQRLLLSARLGARPFKDDSLELAFNVWNITGLVSESARFREHPNGQPIGGRAYGSITYKF